MTFRCLLLLLLLSAPALAAPSEREKKLANDVRWLVNQHAQHMRTGVALIHLPSGERVEVDAKAPYPLASVFKLPIMIELARQMQQGEGSLSLETQLVVKESDKCIGSGTLKNVANGTRVSVNRCIELMETISDNTATDMLFKKIGTGSVNRTMHGWGFKSADIFMTNRQAWLLSLGLGPGLTDLEPMAMARRWLSWGREQRHQAADQVGQLYDDLSLREFQRLEDISRANNTHAEDVVVAAAMDNLCSPADMAGLLADLERGKLLDARWTDYCLDVLGRQQYNTRLPSRLPSGVRVYHKTGTLAGIRNDAGIIDLGGGESLVAVVFTRDLAAGREGLADRLIGQVARLAYDRYR